MESYEILKDRINSDDAKKIHKQYVEHFDAEHSGTVDHDKQKCILAYTMSASQIVNGLQAIESSLHLINSTNLIIEDRKIEMDPVSQKIVDVVDKLSETVGNFRIKEIIELQEEFNAVLEEVRKNSSTK